MPLNITSTGHSSSATYTNYSVVNKTTMASKLLQSANILANVTMSNTTLHLSDIRTLNNRKIKRLNETRIISKIYTEKGIRLNKFREKTLQKTLPKTNKNLREKVSSSLSPHNNKKGELYRVKRVANGYKVPQYSALHKTVASFGRKGKLPCSGFFLTHEKIMSNRHCLCYFKENQTEISKDEFDPSHYSAIFNGRSYPCKEIIFPNDTSVCSSKAPDVIICKLHSPVLQSVIYPFYTGNNSQIGTLKARSKLKLPDGIIIGNGDTVCDKPTAEKHINGYGVAWYRLDTKLLTSGVAYPFKNKDQKYQNICPGDSGSAFLLFNPLDGEFQLAGIAYSSQRTPANKNIDNAEKTTLFEPFFTSSIQQWVKSHYVNNPHVYNSSLDSFLYSSMPRYSNDKFMHKHGSLIKNITYSLSMKFSTWDSLAVYSVLGIKSKIYDVNGMFECVSFSNFPCTITVPEGEEPSTYRVEFGLQIWESPFIRANTNFTINFENLKNTYSLGISSDPVTNITVTTPMPTTTAIKAPVTALKTLNNSTLKVRNTLPNGKGLKIRVSYNHNSSSKRITRIYDIENRGEIPIPIPVGASQIKLTQMQLGTKKEIYKNNKIAERLNKNNSDCIKFTFSKKKTPTVTDYCS